MGTWSTKFELVSSDGLSYEFREGLDLPGRFRVVFSREGKKVVHTFDMQQRWNKRFGGGEGGQ